MGRKDAIIAETTFNSLRSGGAQLSKLENHLDQRSGQAVRRLENVIDGGRQCQDIY